MENKLPIVHLVAGARPNFRKIAPIIRAIEKASWLRYKLIHTGQHYDREMNEVFFDELGIPEHDPLRWPRDGRQLAVPGEKTDGLGCITFQDF